MLVIIMVETRFEKLFSFLSWSPDLLCFYLKQLCVQLSWHLWILHETILKNGSWTTVLRSLTVYSVTLTRSYGANPVQLLQAWSAGKQSKQRLQPAPPRCPARFTTESISARSQQKTQNTVGLLMCQVCKYNCLADWRCSLMQVNQLRWRGTEVGHQELHPICDTGQLTCVGIQTIPV